VNARFISWIWNVEGSLALTPGQSGADALARLDPLFDQPGTTHSRTGDTLTFRKKDQAAQDKMSVFDGGVLRIEQEAGKAVLRYRLASRALLFCFLAPLLFLAFASLTMVAAKFEKASADAVHKPKPPEKKQAEPRQNPIDKALGAPAPEKPKKDDKDKDKDKGPSPTAAFVFAGMFAVLYVVGRVLESRLVKTLFGKQLQAT